MAYAYACLLIGVFVTALYSFRMLFMVFHGNERMDDDARGHLHEPPWVVTLPLTMLAIPSMALIGWFTPGPVVFGDYFGSSIFVLPANDVVGQLAEDWHGPLAFMLHGFATPPLYLALAGVGLAWYLYLKNPSLPGPQLHARFGAVHRLLEKQVLRFRYPGRAGHPRRQPRASVASSGASVT